eukprot:Gregarina_sp_Poly_1__5611@NODE_2960_length_1503_cov_140_371866_g1711_i2_p3_GENE_NODE_2960_length_1503_cov_140_371866_g1711_i2NODE_2960_length_1503_cov_140_371866_g1711_i2_p3_ORF_typecomplete_len123_score4_01IDH/PF03971_14/0_036_NODE_2960_length_1503_cov_140_371866_g1711_i2439807
MSLETEPSDTDIANTGRCDIQFRIHHYEVQIWQPSFSETKTYESMSNGLCKIFTSLSGSIREMILIPGSIWRASNSTKHSELINSWVRILKVWRRRASASTSTTRDIIFVLIRVGTSEAMRS